MNYVFLRFRITDATKAEKPMNYSALSPYRCDYSRETGSSD